MEWQTDGRPMKKIYLSRRKLIQTGVLGGTFLAASSGLVYLLDPFHRPDAAQGDWLLLREGDLPALLAIAPIILGSRLPAAEEARAEQLQRVLHSADALLYYSSEEIHRQSRQVLDLLSYPAYRILFTGIARPWEEAGEADIRDFLDRWSNSRMPFLQSIIHALTRVIQAAWYAVPESIQRTGYPGIPNNARVLVED